MKIIGLAGSLRDDSYSSKALNIIMRKISEHGVHTEVIDLHEYQLPFCNGAKDYPAYPDVARFRHVVKNADGIVLASPEYHGSISGVLKNALDLLDIEHVDGAVFSLIVVCGGEFSTNAINTMRVICHSLHAWVTPDQVVICNVGQAFDENGELRSSQIDKRMREMGVRLIDYVKKLTGTP